MHTPLRTLRKGRMIKRPGTMWGVCDTPLPYRQERGDTKAEKYRPGGGLTSPHSSSHRIITAIRSLGCTGSRGVLHTPLRTPRKGCMIRRPDTCGAYAIHPYSTDRRGAVPIILTITTAPPDITKAGATLHCFRNVGPGLIASVRL